MLFCRRLSSLRSPRCNTPCERTRTCRCRSSALLPIRQGKGEVHCQANGHCSLRPRVRIRRPGSVARVIAASDRPRPARIAPARPPAARTAPAPAEGRVRPLAGSGCPRALGLQTPLQPWGQAGIACSSGRGRPRGGQAGSGIPTRWPGPERGPIRALAGPGSSDRNNLGLAYSLRPG